MNATTAAHTPALEARDLGVRFGDTTILHGISLVLPRARWTSIVGPNGAGKSTLLKALAGLLAPLGGRIERGGLSPRDIAYLPQLVDIDRSFPINVCDFIAMGAMRRVGLFGRLDGSERERTAQAVARVGLEGMEDRPIDTLSGGQMQRVLFARLIVQDQRVILLDEPFGAIDEATTGDLLTLIADWRAEGRTVVAVLHELDLARRAFPQTLLLARELVAWGETRTTLSAENLARARAMSEAYDRQARECLRDEEAAHVH